MTQERSSASFPCPACGQKAGMVTIDSRLSVRIGGIRRRRKCLHCGDRFTTYEILRPDHQRQSELAKQRATQLIADALTILRTP